MHPQVPHFVSIIKHAIIAHDVLRKYARPYTAPLRVQPPDIFDTVFGATLPLQMLGVRPASIKEHLSKPCTGQNMPLETTAAAWFGLAAPTRVYSWVPCLAASEGASSKLLLTLSCAVVAVCCVAVLQAYNIGFNSLLCLNNMPIKRFADWLLRNNAMSEYMSLLVSHLHRDV